MRCTAAEQQLRSSSSLKNPLLRRDVE